MSGVVKILTFGLIGSPSVAKVVAPIAAIIAPFFPPAAILAAAANLSMSLQAKPPPARGSVTQLIVAADAPTPYVMGEGLTAGVLRYQRSYGATLDGVPNPYRFKVVVYSGGGPVEAITPKVDQAAIGSYYTGYLYTTSKLGLCPDTALVPQWSGAPGWTTSSKLSGKACLGWSLKFDKNGKVFAGGEPQLSALVKGVKVYDPRLDSTRAGGSGSHRVDDESTWAWSENPALHAATYAYGRHQNGKRVFGIGLPDEAIDWANVAAWANVCDANDWRLYGVIYEPGARWDNLRDICAAGGAEPVPTAAGLHFLYSAPRVALATVTEADLIAGEEQGVTAQQSWRDRINTIIPKFRDPASNWELVQAGAVTVSTLVTEDGEVKQAEWPFNLVKDLDQAAQLARYRIEDSRELQPIDLVVGPHLRHLRPGDCLDLDLMDFLGLEGKAVIVRREFDPAGLSVKLTLVSETSAKHAFALGQTTTAPPTPALGQTAEERDALLAATTAEVRGIRKFVSKTVAYPLSGGEDLLAWSAFSGVLDDGSSISIAAGSITTGLTDSTIYAVIYDPDTDTFSAVASPATTEMANRALVFLGWQSTSSAAGVYADTGTPPEGFGGDGPHYYYEAPL